MRAPSSLQSFALATCWLVLSCASDSGEPTGGGGALNAGGRPSSVGGGGSSAGAGNGTFAGAANSGGSFGESGGALGASGSAGAAVGGAIDGGAGRGGAFNTSGGKGGAGGGASAGAGGSPVTDCQAPPLTGGTQRCSSNQSGTAGGYTWTIWSSGSGGCLTSYGKGAAFKATWNKSGDFLSRVGLQWDETKTYDQYGTISADYAYTKTGDAGGYSFIGIYGWSNNPLVEYYIVDDWFGSGPPTGGGTMKGTLNVDDGTYNIYTHTQNNQPSIHGNQTFPQFFSVRQKARQCGHISISEHFKKWASLGMTLGKMYEAKLLVEAGGGTGSIDYKSASFTIK